MYEYYVKKVENVVDGDTIDVLIDLGFDILFASRVRLAGIDTPESRTKDLAEKALGLEAKEYLKKHFKDAKSVILKTEKMDSSEKYGRILGWVYVDGNTISLNDMMINDGYAWGYLGDTKVKDFNALKKILYFTADWCAPCKRVRPIVEQLNKDQSDVRFFIIDVDLETEMASDFEIKSVPTFVVMKDNTEIHRVSGVQTRDQLEELINYE